MTEYTITRKDAERDLNALRAVLSGFPVSVSSSVVPALRELVEAIEEQVKPAVEEPSEFGSIVRAGVDGLSDRVLWQRGPKKWHSETGDLVACFKWLDHPEILRVGIGEPQPPTYEQLVASVPARFCTLRSDCRMADGHEGACQP